MELKVSHKMQAKQISEGAVEGPDDSWFTPVHTKELL
jgi:hypothetical protein